MTLKTKIPESFQGDIRCLCGGTFILGRTEELAFVKHTMPYCADFERIETNEDACNLSQRCRAALGDFRSTEEH